MRGPLFTRLFQIAALMAAPACADVLYSNGPIGVNIDAFYLGGNIISDTFTLSSNSTLVGVSNLGIWVDNGGTPANFDWIISTDVYGGGTVEASGTWSGTPTEITADNGSGQNIYHDSVWNVGFTLPNLNLLAGTYYLSLDHGGVDRWDATFGPSSAYGAVLNNGSTSNSQTLVVSDSFEIDGPTASAPEPSAILLFATGLIGLLALKRL